MDIIDHIKQLDEEHGNKLRNLCINSNNYEAILEIYFNDIREIGRPEFEISDRYHDNLAHFLYHKSIDFDQYVIYLVTFLNELQPYNLQPDNDGNYHLNDRLRISKTLNKNTFTYYSESSSQNIKITFIITQSVPKKNALNFQMNSVIIKLDNLTITAKKHPEKIYLNKVFSKITPYFLFTLLILTIVFAAFTENTINLTNHLFSINLYSKIAILIFILCGFILVSPIYKIVESLREYSRVVLSFKINKKYSNTEKYLRSFDDEKKQKVPLFENRERPINTPNEDFLGFNLLSASLFYNSVENSFDPNINLITIIDARRGMGKTSFINLLVQRINGFTYRHNGDCQLFKNILTHKQIKIVQFSIMPFLAGLNSNNEKEYINNFITFIAQNLTPSSSKYLKAILSSTTAFNDKFNLEKFISQLGNNDDIAKLKNNLKLSEQKNLIIIEDLDRLSEEQLKIFAKALWFIHDLPFTITLLPAEEEKIKKAVNLPINAGNNYEELEEYKLFQFSFSLKEHFYKLLANYAMKQYDNTIKKEQINNELIQLKQFNNNVTSVNNIQNDWVSHLYKNNLVKNNAYTSMRLHNKDVISSIKNELISVFKKYNISLREFKAILGMLYIGVETGYLLYNKFYFI